MLSKGVPVPLFLMQRNGDGNSFFVLLKQNTRDPGVRRITFNVTGSFIRSQKYDHR